MAAAEDPDSPLGYFTADVAVDVVVVFDVSFGLLLVVVVVDSGGGCGAAAATSEIL